VSCVLRQTQRALQVRLKTLDARLTLKSHFDRKKPPPPGGFCIYYVPSSRAVCKRTPLEGFVPNASRGVLLHTALDEGT